MTSKSGLCPGIQKNSRTVLAQVPSCTTRVLQFSCLLHNTSTKMPAAFKACSHLKILFPLPCLRVMLELPKAHFVISSADFEPLLLNFR